MRVFAEYFEHWDNYTSMTSSSINIDAGFFSVVNAKFSSSYMSTKSHQVNEKSRTTRVQVRHRLYVVKAQPDSQLHPVFKSRLFDIAANLQNNNTEYAHYLAELLVRDYGTHVVTSMDAGAVLAQEDHGQWAVGEDETSSITQITASAGANFFGKVSLDSTFTHSTSEQDRNGYVSSRTYSEVITAGGPPFRPNFTVADWEDGVADALVATDRSGDPLHFVVNPTTLSELPETTIRRVAMTVYKAINRYYKVNTRDGCTNPNSPNFNFQANVDDSSCNPPQTNFTFGGIFQTCKVHPDMATEDLCNSGPEPAAQVNPLTGDYSCRDGYMPVKLHSGTVTHMTQKMVCNNVCHHCGFLGWHRCCQCQSVLASFLSAADYEAYWCVANGEVAQNSGYLFGGFYTSTTSNPFTDSMTCPRYFIPLHFGEDIKVCVSSDYEQGYAYSIPFAGFESCIAGNPLAALPSYVNESARWPHACPHGYMQHLVTVDEGCEINFCVEMGALSSKKLLPAKLPPFRKHPRYKMNVTSAMIVFGVYGQVWLKKENGEWETASYDELASDGANLLELMARELGDNTDPAPSTDDPTQSSGNQGSLSNGIVAAISVVATILALFVGVVVIFAGRSYIKKKHQPKVQATSAGYIQINDSSGDGSNNGGESGV